VVSNALRLRKFLMRLRAKTSDLKTLDLPNISITIPRLSLFVSKEMARLVVNSAIRYYVASAGWMQCAGGLERK
jgi:hypothetical protein